MVTLVGIGERRSQVAFGGSGWVFGEGWTGIRSHGFFVGGKGEGWNRKSFQEGLEDYIVKRLTWFYKFNMLL
jgi:hypothetical protein